MRYIKMFFIYSILGFLLESSVALIFGWSFESGILFGPWTPVYGFGTILIHTLSQYLFLHLHLNRIIETIIVFFIVTILLTLLEWFGGVLIEAIFHTHFWDYSNHAYHIGPYISLTMSLLWGVGSIFFIYLINPKCNRWFEKIPNWIFILLIFLFAIDLVLTWLYKI